MNSKEIIEATGRIIGRTDVEGQLAFLGQHYSEDNFTRTEFLILDKNFNTRNNYTVETNIFDNPIGVVFDGKHHYLFVGHVDWRRNVKNNIPLHETQRESAGGGK